MQAKGQEVVAADETILAQLLRELRPMDVMVSMGAGDIYQLGHQLLVK